MSEKTDEMEYQSIEANFQNAMANARKAGESALKPVGSCYNCHEEVEGTRVFCDMDCQEDYEKRKFARTQRLY